MSMTNPFPLLRNKIQGLPRTDYELEVDDLVMWDGKPSEHCSFRHGMIYRVVEKHLPDPEKKTAYEIIRYKFITVFDFTRPIGQPVDTFEFSTTRDLKRLSLLDLGTLRLHFDNFIREWAKHCGMETDEKTG